MSASAAIPTAVAKIPWSLNDHGGGLIGGRFDIAGYLDHQGESFLERFDANSYLAILRTMDTWDPLRGNCLPVKSSAAFRRSSASSASVLTCLFPAESVRAFAKLSARPASPRTTAK